MPWQKPSPLRAVRQYSALEQVPLPAVPQGANTPVSMSVSSMDVGPLEHAIDAFHLRNEGSLINDFRDDVTDPDAAKSSRRRPNCAVVPVVINGDVHAVCYATKPIPAGHELLLDYGEDYWAVYSTRRDLGGGGGVRSASRGG